MSVITSYSIHYTKLYENLRLKVEAALRYPTFVMTFAALVVVAMVVKIIPMFTGIYDRFKVPLPAPTRALLDLSTFVTHNLFVLALARNNFV